MKYTPALPLGLALAALLFLPASAAAQSYSGTVTDLSGHPMSGAGIALSVAGFATSTDPSGAWSLSTGTTALSRDPAVVATSVTRHLVLDGRHIRPRFCGVDGAGRTHSPSDAGTQDLASLRTTGSGPAARAATGPDTLLFAWNGRVRARVVAASFTSGSTQTIDTSTTSADIPWTSGITYGSLTDSRDNQVYKTVKIGTQTWMAQNLDYAGTSAGSIGVWYDNNPDSGAKYGRLYTWSDAMARNASITAGQDVCPADWHVPSDVEWSTLTTFVGGESSAATLLKSIGGWKGSGNGTDPDGFRGLPGGYAVTGTYYNLGTYAVWWSATGYAGSYAWGRRMTSSSAAVSNNLNDAASWFSVRCLAN